METERSESQERLNDLYNIALSKHIVKNKTEFANLIGVHQSNFSTALNSPAGPRNVDSMVMKAERALISHGIIVDGEGNLQAVGNNNTLGLPAKNFAHERDWFDLIKAKDGQIDRLLTQQENFLKLSNRLTEQNQMLIEKLTK